MKKKIYPFVSCYWIRVNDTLSRETTPSKLYLFPSGMGLFYKERFCSKMEQILSLYSGRPWCVVKQAGSLKKLSRMAAVAEIPPSMFLHLNPCPAEPGYSLPLQSVQIQFRSQLIWIYTVCYSICEFTSTIWIK